MWHITNALRGIGGEFELNRVLGAFGTFVYVIAVQVYEAYQIFGLGKEFNVTEYCLAFPGGLAVCAGAIAGSVALKDRQVAAATVIKETGAVPTASPAGPQVPTEEKHAGELKPEERVNG